MELDNDDLYKKCNELNFYIEDKVGRDDIVFNEEADQLTNINYEMSLAIESLTLEHRGLEEALRNGRSQHQESKIKIDKLIGVVHKKKEEILKRRKIQAKKQIELGDLHDELGINSDQEQDDLFYLMR